MRDESSSNGIYLAKNKHPFSNLSQKSSESENDGLIDGYLMEGQSDEESNNEKDIENDNKPFQLYKRRTTVIVKRDKFLDVVCDALAEYKYVGPNKRADLVLACRCCIIFFFGYCLSAFPHVMYFLI